MTITSRFQEVFYCASVHEVPHEGETYYVTDGTGDGVFAYDDVSFEAGVEAAEAASEDHYTAFCQAASPCHDTDVAIAVHKDTGLSICFGGVCTPVLNFVDVQDALLDFDFEEEEGSAYVRDHGLYARSSDGADERYLGAVSDEDEAKAEVKRFFD